MGVDLRNPYVPVRMLRLFHDVLGRMASTPPPPGHHGLLNVVLLVGRDEREVVQVVVDVSLPLLLM